MVKISASLGVPVLVQLHFALYAAWALNRMCRDWGRISEGPLYIFECHNSCGTLIVTNIQKLHGTYGSHFPFPYAEDYTNQEYCKSNIAISTFNNLQSDWKATICQKSMLVSTETILSLHIATSLSWTQSTFITETLFKKALAESESPAEATIPSIIHVKWHEYAYFIHVPSSQIPLIFFTHVQTVSEYKASFG